MAGRERARERPAAPPPGGAKKFCGSKRLTGEGRTKCLARATCSNNKPTKPKSNAIYSSLGIPSIYPRSASLWRRRADTDGERYSQPDQTNISGNSKLSSRISGSKRTSCALFWWHHTSPKHFRYLPISVERVQGIRHEDPNTAAANSSPLFAPFGVAESVCILSSEVQPVSFATSSTSHDDHNIMFFVLRRRR